MCLSGLEIRAAEPEPFSYVITAAGTENIQTFPDQGFNWSVSATSTEKWKATTIKDVTVSVHAAGSRDRTGEDKKTFVPAKTEKVSVSYSGSDRGGWGVTVQLDGDRIFVGSQISAHKGGGKIDVIQGKTYLITATARDGSCGLSVTYSAQVTEEKTAARTANYSAPASVNAKDDDKFLGPLPPAAYPRSQEGGGMSEPVFQISDDNERVETRIDGANVFARTAYVETRPQAWHKTETGRATVSSSEGLKLIATSALTAPNGDTRWTDGDDNPNVETSMIGNKLFAKVVQSGPPKYHSADYRDPRWQIDDSEMNRVLAYWRAGAYHIDSQGLDGFVVGPGATNGPRHSADFREPFWIIDDTEMNHLLAYWRAGGYEVNSNGPDGYAPVALPKLVKAQTPSPKGQAQSLLNKQEQKAPTTVKPLQQEQKGDSKAAPVRNR